MKNKIDLVKKVDKYLLAGSIFIAILMLSSLVFGTGFKKAEANDFLFSFKSGSVILIDKNLNFKSPERVEAKDNLVINLKKGIYYWKVDDAIPEEDVVQLEITESAASLKLRKLDVGYEVVNFGNASLNVDIYSSGKFTGSVTLSGDESREVSGIINIGDEND